MLFCRKPIFGCIGVQDHEPSWEAAYDLRPFGACMQFVKKGSKLKLEDWLKSSHRFAANWTHPIPVYVYDEYDSLTKVMFLSFLSYALLHMHAKTHMHAHKHARRHADMCLHTHTHIYTYFQWHIDTCISFVSKSVSPSVANISV